MALLETARINNFRFAITGMLVFERGVFMQVIEGPKENVEHLLSALQADPRHHKIQILSVKPIHAREFGEWDMAFFRECALKVPLIWVEGRMKKKNPSSGIGLPKRIETAGFAL